MSTHFSSSLQAGQWLETTDCQACCEFHSVSGSHGWLQTSSVAEGGSEHLTFPPKYWVLVFQERAPPSWDCNFFRGSNASMKFMGFLVEFS